MPRLCASGLGRCSAESAFYRGPPANTQLKSFWSVWPGTRGRRVYNFVLFYFILNSVSAVRGGTSERSFPSRF